MSEGTFSVTGLGEGFREGVRLGLVRGVDLIAPVQVKIGGNILLLHLLDFLPNRAKVCFTG